MKFQQLLEEVKQYVTSYFDAYQDPELIYHNIKHTKDVVTAATKIANHYQLSDEDFFVVVSSAWFHDTGYFTDRADHEAKSISIAEHEIKLKPVSWLPKCLRSQLAYSRKFYAMPIFFI
jgi:predicted metal-dependent HD superfamily phosphohydrolase